MKYFLFSAAFILIFNSITTSCAIAAEIIGHRGAAFYAPENTLASVRTAIEMKADGVEIDVFLTRDKKIAVIHDAGTKRLSGGKTDYKVAETDYAVLEKIDVGGHKGEKFKGEKIPLLEEVLELIPDGKKLFIEIKCGAEIFEVLPSELKKVKRRVKIVIISFSLDVAALARILLPKVESYWILNDDFFNGAGINDAIKIALANNLDGLDTDHKSASAEFIKAVKNAGLKYYVWTVDDPGRAAVLNARGLDGITTNKPDVIKKAVECEK